MDYSVSVTNIITDGMLWFENYEVNMIFTPVKADVLEQLLIQAEYSAKKRRFLVNGFRRGFSLQYKGSKKVKLQFPNLRLDVGSKLILWNKVMKEVGEKRFAGPFTQPPFEYYIQSPIGLVAKDRGKDTRLIFHLSHPRSKPGTSVNSNIPQRLCKVKYKDFDMAVVRCLEEGEFCVTAKSDMKSAFRHLCMRVNDFCWLLMKCECPSNGVTYWFFDKCLAFGLSISCALFQEFSDCVAHLVHYRTPKSVINYLDDYLLVDTIKRQCNSQVKVFLAVCKQINFPVSLEKTVWASFITVFLGLLLNTMMQTVSLPVEKIERAKLLLEELIAKRKVTVLQLQKLTGFLNFLCRAIVPGRTFLRRLYMEFGPQMKPHYHIRLSNDMKEDVKVWLHLLNHPSVYSRPFIDYSTTLSAQEIDMYSDATLNYDLGFAAYCQNSWLAGRWDKQFMEKFKPSIQFVELYALTAGVLTWIHWFKNR